MTGWEDSNQGELVPTVIHASKTMQVMTISSEADEKNLFKKDRQYLVLIDKKTEGCNWNKAFFPMIDPRRFKSYIDGSESYYKINEAIESYLNTLNPDNWQIVRSAISPNLITFAAAPK
jgi:hypothetical protein